MQCGKPSAFFKIHHGGYDLDVVAMGITLVSANSRANWVPADSQKALGTHVRSPRVTIIDLLSCMRS